VKIRSVNIGGAAKLTATKGGVPSPVRREEKKKNKIRRLLTRNMVGKRKYERDGLLKKNPAGQNIGRSAGS